MSHLNREPFHKHQNSPSLLNSGLERKVNGEILTVLKNHVQSICASKYCHQCVSLVVFDRFWGNPPQRAYRREQREFRPKDAKQIHKTKKLKKQHLFGLAKVRQLF